MAFPVANMIEQARHLASRDASGRPRQDHLRRAVSTTYYALFHYLSETACRRFFGVGPERVRIRAVVSRTFDHATMKRASRSFAAGSLPDSLEVIAVLTPPPHLRFVAKTFVSMQERRHEADYDPLRRFSRKEVQALIDDVETAVERWEEVSASPVAEMYLIALMFGDRLRS